MYYQVGYYDKRSKKNVRSRQIHPTQSLAHKELMEKIAKGHKNCVIFSGSKLTKR